ncbi:MAG TPA: hypothetical protein HA282_04910 [Nanoarchaeota archaeon]|nr:MAG: hypothetical protein QT01_C0009G0022 [archaeon GW2011_AR6]MBS3082891.1 hypothetical protein [Candidatus Pacearchaeota archaeon]HIH17609.1 hypothetical protein [Nanoarchaeota archaeon]HIH34601.1 hypothetical protein [Nanoarchaeota archaeon]HIH51405.1 hypothetical protein [Nanoarchaeota archaeon]
MKGEYQYLEVRKAFERAGTRRGDSDGREYPGVLQLDLVYRGAKIFKRRGLSFTEIKDPSGSYVGVMCVDYPEKRP